MSRSGRSQRGDLFGPSERPNAGIGLSVPDELLDALADRVAARVLAVADRSAPAGSPWLDVAGAADYLRCKPKRLYDLCSQRRVPVHREGSRLLFRRDELDAWITSGAADTALTPPRNPALAGGSRAEQGITDPHVTGSRHAA